MCVFVCVCVCVFIGWMVTAEFVVRNSLTVGHLYLLMFLSSAQRGGTSQWHLCKMLSAFACVCVCMCACVSETDFSLVTPIPVYMTTISHYFVLTYQSETCVCLSSLWSACCSAQNILLCNDVLGVCSAI